MLRMLPGISTHLLTHPDGVEHVLKRNQKNYRKPSTFARPVAPAAYPADEQLPPPWAEFAGAGPLGPPPRSDLYRDEAAPEWPGPGAAVGTHDG